MKIQVLDDAGGVAFSYDTDKASLCVCPGLTEKPGVVAALTEATSFLGSDHSAIASIRGDISAVIGRIEHELGAAPAFSWAQIKLSHAAAHLEAYVAGSWTEPPIVHGVVTDQRGVILSVAPVPGDPPKPLQPIASPAPTSLQPTET